MTQHGILVMDANPTNFKLLQEVLAGAGYQLFMAADAESAADMVRDQAPDLILINIAVPGRDGLNLTRMLKADRKTRPIIIVALTALAMPGDVLKAYAAGCDGYITKPINTRTLAATLQSFLTRKLFRRPAPCPSASLPRQIQKVTT